jgi:hypothetical protein
LGILFSINQLFAFRFVTFFRNEKNGYSIKVTRKEVVTNAEINCGKLEKMERQKAREKTNFSKIVAVNFALFESFMPLSHPVTNIEINK